MKFRRKQGSVEAEQWFPGKAVAGVKEALSDPEDGEPSVVGVIEVGGRVIALKAGEWLVRGECGKAWAVEAETFPLYYQPAGQADCERRKGRIDACRVVNEILARVDGTDREAATRRLLLREAVQAIERMERT